MKLYLLKCFLFLLPLMVCYGTLEYLTRHLHSGYLAKKNDVTQNAGEIEILVVGNSHASMGIKPSAFKNNAYNIAYGAQSILYDKEIILHFLPKLKKLKYVIISIDYPSLYWGFIEDRDFFYYNYYGINLHNRNYYKQRFSFFFYVYNPNLALNLIYNNEQYKFDKGWSDGAVKTDYSAMTKEYGLKKVNSFNSDIKNSIRFGETFFIRSEIESLIKTLKDKNIEPILVTAPCYKYYTNELDPRVEKDKLNFIHHLQKKYGIHYLNAQSDTSFKEHHFFNVDHLSVDGAALFTSKIQGLIDSVYTNK